MARQYRRISADCHLDMLWLPPDLFTSNASSKNRDKMPYVAEQADGVKRWVDHNGADYGRRRLPSLSRNRSASVRMISVTMDNWAANAYPRYWTRRK